MGIGDIFDDIRDPGAKYRKPLPSGTLKPFVRQLEEEWKWEIPDLIKATQGLAGNSNILKKLGLPEKVSCGAGEISKIAKGEAAPFYKDKKSGEPNPNDPKPVAILMAYALFQFRIYREEMTIGQAFDELYGMPLLRKQPEPDASAEAPDYR